MIRWAALGALAVIVWRGVALYAAVRRARRLIDDELRPDWSEVDPYRAALIRDSGRDWR